MKPTSRYWMFAATCGFLLGAGGLAPAAWVEATVSPPATHAARQHQASKEDPGRGLQYRGAPVVLGNDAARVGELIPDLELKTLTGRTTRISAVTGSRGLVIAMRDPGCPLSKKYGPRLASMEREFDEQGFDFLFVDPMPYGTAEEGHQEIEWYGFAGEYVVDPKGRIAAALGAVTSTEVFVLVAARTLMYRGAVDDQYGLGYTKPAADQEFLRSALAATAAATLPAVRATLAPGCYLSFDEAVLAAMSAAPPTWHNGVSRIVQARCQRCHRAGAAGPFPLVEYRDVVRRKDMIEWVLADGLMPPWFAEGHEEWANDPSLSAEEMATFKRWLTAGTPEGDSADAPIPIRWTEGWTLGQPDADLPIPEGFTVPAEGVVDYQYQYIKTDFAEDRWVQAVEILPGAPEVVHHVLLFVEEPEVRERALEGDPDAQNVQQGGARGYFASNVPGQDGVRFPQGFGKLLPAGAWLKVQLHYTPNGRELVDRTRIGLHFADEPGHTEVRTNSALNMRFTIPPGAGRHQVVADYTFDEPSKLLSLLPHTHVRGVAFRYELVSPGGDVEELLSIPRYDFNWQLNYELRSPRSVAAGMILRATAWYDNSADNLANPDPTAEISWGEQTFEEMMIGYVNWVPLGAAAEPTSVPDAH